MSLIRLLETGKCTNVTDKYTEKQIVHILTLGHRLNALDLCLQNLIGPLGDAGKEVLKRLEGLTRLLVAHTGSLGVIIDTPKTVGNVRD
jgi:hypothetical protein